MSQIARVNEDHRRGRLRFEPIQRPTFLAGFLLRGRELLDAPQVFGPGKLPPVRNRLSNRVPLAHLGHHGPTPVVVAGHVVGEGA